MDITKPSFKNDVLLAYLNITKQLKKQKLKVINHFIQKDLSSCLIECKYKNNNVISICIEYLKEGGQCFSLEARQYSGEEDTELQQDFYIVCIARVSNHQYWILTKDEMKKALDNISLKDALYSKAKNEYSNIDILQKDEYYNKWEKLIK